MLLKIISVVPGGRFAVLDFMPPSEAGDESESDSCSSLDDNEASVLNKQSCPGCDGNDKSDTVDGIN